MKYLTVLKTFYDISNRDTLVSTKFDNVQIISGNGYNLYLNNRDMCLTAVTIRIFIYNFNGNKKFLVLFSKKDSLVSGKYDNVIIIAGNGYIQGPSIPDIDTS